MPGARRRHSSARPRPPVRVRNAARSARPRAARRLHAAGLRAMSFGVESVSAETLKKVGPPADPAGAAAARHRSLPLARHRHGRRSTCSDSRTTTGTRLPRRSTTPSTSGSTVAQFKLLTPYPGTPLWKQLGAARLRERLGASSTGSRRPSTTRSLTRDELQFLLGGRLQPLLPAAVVSGELLPDRRARPCARDRAARCAGRRGIHTRREVAQMAQEPSRADRDLPLRRARHPRTPSRSSRRCRARGELDRGPADRRVRAGVRATRSAARRAPSARRTAGWRSIYLLKALDLPAGSEIIFPALTFWVVPEMARVAGLTPVFADVDPAHVQHRSRRRSSAPSRRGPSPSCRRISTACRATWTPSCASPGGTTCG